MSGSTALQLQRQLQDTFSELSPLQQDLEKAKVFRQVPSLSGLKTLLSNTGQVVLTGNQLVKSLTAIL